ncbi:alpha/beta fold hydrolase [Gordonia crocea]|uniref:alpha/beta fold hydrolase n=1 Tax=Gordonia crocea TaxID=589162 RepID=UPI00137A257E|nr:alpha/beta fold hydrolase [Gordonia crocea]
MGSTDKLAVAIAELCADQFDISPVHPTDSFDLLGLSSLQVEQFLREVRRRLGVDIGAADVAGNPPIAAIAKQLQARRRSRFFKPTSTVVFREAAGQPVHIHLIAGAGATAAGFIPLVNVLPVTAAITAYQARGFESFGIPEWTTAQAARRIASSIGRADNSSLHILVGHSFGGYLAAETTHRLRAKGIPVAGTVLIDSVLRRPDVAVATESSAAGSPRTPPPLAERLRMHALVAIAGPIRFDAKTHQAAMGERWIRAQNRHRLGRLPDRTSVLVTDENSDQVAHWEKLSARTSTITRIPGNHHDALHGRRQVAAIRDAVGAYLPVSLAEVGSTNQELRSR